MLTAMRGQICTDPVLKPMINKRTNEELQMADFLLAYQKEPDAAKTVVRCVAWEEQAKKLVQMKRGQEIEFVGNLTYNEYKNPQMDKSHTVLGFSITAVDESKTVCQKLEEFMGVKRRPDEKAGTIFQPVRGKLLNKPELREVKDSDGNPLNVCDAVLRYWNGRKGVSDALVNITAFGEQAKELAALDKDTPIQFVGRLDSKPYINERMEHPHMELCFNVVSLDPERKLCREADKFLREQAGLAKHPPLKDKIQDAQTRKSAAAPAEKDTQAHKVTEPVLQ